MYISNIIKGITYLYL